MIDLAKIAAFNAFNPENANTIARGGENGDVVAGGTYSSANLFRWMRSASTKDANNAIRTELLKSLGEALGVDGMMTGEDGKVHFSKNFMDQLERTLGKANLKRGDFEIDKNGLVSSGKPLTERRIKALVGCVEALAREEQGGTEAEEPVAVGPKGPLAPEAKAPGGAAINQEVLAAYNAKKAEVLEDIEGGFISKLTAEPIETLFHHIAFELSAFEQLPERFKDVHNDLEAMQAFQRATGMICHPEYIPVKDKTTEVYLNYAKSVITEYINLLMERFVNDQSAEMKESTAIPTQYPCMEGKTSILQEAKSARDFGAVADHEADTPLSDCIFAEIDAYQKNHPGKGNTWKECKKMLKDHLVGVVRPIDTYKKGEHVEAVGKPRKIKAADIDNLKPYILATLVMDA